ncbi:MAG: tail fiber protein [Bacilli bacterium]|nr:tail fiber protein [Bacilli bacterium]
MNKGFTLIELLASIVVIAIISLVSIPIITGVVNKTKLNALKVSAENLIDATRLYNAQYNNEETVRFDIANNKITSTDTDKLLKYKGSIKAGTVIVDTKGRSVICVTDGSRSAYKNYGDNVVSVSNNKTCNIPAGGSIVYLGNEATITELSNQDLTRQLQELQNTVSTLQSELTTLKNKPSDSTPIGTIISYSTTNVPDGYLECNGQAVSRTEYAALFEKIGTTYGGGDGSTTFNVPNLRGEFLRGAGTNSRTSQGSGSAVGTHQDATIHQWVYPTNGNMVAGFDGQVWLSPGNSDHTVTSQAKYNTNSGGSISTNATVTAKYTSRPTNTSVLFCIKY